MNTKKRLYRSRNYLLGGVCSGLADYLNVDTLVTRILSIVITLATAGLFVVAYLVLWAILPLRPGRPDPFEVKPHAVHSDTYGRLEIKSDPGDEEGPLHPFVGGFEEKRDITRDAYRGVGHVPPEPPLGVAHILHWHHLQRELSSQDMSSCQSCSYPEDSWTQKQQEGVAEEPLNCNCDRPSAWTQHRLRVEGLRPAQAPAQFLRQRSHEPKKRASTEPMGTGVKIAIWLAAFLLFMGIASLLDRHIEGIHWWQFWPLILAIVGIVNMIVPGQLGYNIKRFVSGLMLFSMSGCLLIMSLNVVSWLTLSVMLVNLWPLLLVMLGFFLMSAIFQSSWWVLAAGLCFVAFCVLGIIWFALPGDMPVIVLSLPFNRELIVPFF